MSYPSIPSIGIKILTPNPIDRLRLKISVESKSFQIFPASAKTKPYIVGESENFYLNSIEYLSIILPPSELR